MIAGTLFIFLVLAAAALWLFKDKLNVWDKDLYIGFLSYSGAIIGGLFTLFGVYFTLLSTKKSKEAEAIPEKIDRIEVAMNHVKKAYETSKGYLFDERRDQETVLISINTKSIDESKTLDDLVITSLNRIKAQLIYVDSESYKRVLKAKEDLEHIRDLCIIDLRLDYFGDGVFYEPDGLGGFKKSETYEKILPSVRTVNQRMLGEISKVYRELDVDLKKKHEKLIKQLK